MVLVGPGVWGVHGIQGDWWICREGYWYVQRGGGGELKIAQSGRGRVEKAQPWG